MSQWWVVFEDELSWLFTNRISATSYMKVKRMGITETLRKIWLFDANKMKSSESGSKQPTQIIFKLNSSLRHIIVTLNLCSGQNYTTGFWWLRWSWNHTRRIIFRPEHTNSTCLHSFQLWFKLKQSIFRWYRHCEVETPIEIQSQCQTRLSSTRRSFCSWMDNGSCQRMGTD